MSIKEAHALVTPEEASCRRCGYPRLQSVSLAQGESRHWATFCPVCRHVHDSVSIPESFLEGLSPGAEGSRFH